VDEVDRLVGIKPENYLKVLDEVVGNNANVSL
jgi:hypothetical protein